MNRIRAHLKCKHDSPRIYIPLELFVVAPASGERSQLHLTRRGNRVGDGDEEGRHSGAVAGRRRRRHAPARRVGRRRADARVQVLRPEVPRRRVHRVRRGPEGVERRPEHAGQPPPPPLPRLLRQRVRRVGVAGGERRAGGEERAAEPEPARLRGHRQGEGEVGGDVQADRLLRRHPHLRRPRQRQGHDRRLQVRGARREAGRDGVAGQHDRRPPAAEAAERGPPRAVLHQEGPDRRRHGGALRRAHARRRQVRHVRVQADQPQRQGHGRRVPERAEEAVQLQLQQRRRPRRRQRVRLRHQLLRQRARQPHRARVRRRAPLAQDLAEGHPAQGQPDAVHEQLRHRHGQDGQPPRRLPRQGPRQLQAGQDVMIDQRRTMTRLVERQWRAARLTD